ncbi:LysR substrate-binding domain-containing protein [Aquabacterium sp.]|uniref:LysR substrate-binding domain-containing protein n=1 Tax=Aquabacterium sp. TaxID=1872578 RepID=UPI002CE9BAF8|nr:LysR substrate-binding domain-containing protein [Aquabacterium sp.]HSW06952.1 LysR substrate-binding domain-containing protein [Aquabacterium sp.]
MNITFRQLRVFAEVVRQGSVQRAAEQLHLTPPAVSMQIKELESQVGLPLFDRTGRRLSLSTAGEYFVVYARRLLGTLKEAEDAMARFTGVESGLLTIGMVSSSKYFLPQLLAQFHAEHPAVAVRLRLGNREQLVALMQANEVDMSVMGRAPKEWPNRAEPFAAHPHVLVTAPSHPFARAESVPAAALAREGFIVREQGSGTRAALEEYLSAQHLQPMFIMELPNDEAIKQAVMAGLGVSLVSRHTIGLEWRSGLISTPPVEGLPLMRRWNLVTAAAKALSPAAEAFRYFMLERAEVHLAGMFGGEAALG